MAGRSADESVVRDRKRAVEDGEPLLSDTRKLSVTGGPEDPSVMVNVASEACKIIGFPRGEDAVGTDVVVEIHEDRYVVRPLDEEGGDEEGNHS